MATFTPVNYFSYGSNLCRENFSSRYKGFGGRPIEFTRARAAVLREWGLAFNAYFCPPAEPVMASIEREAGGEVHGILYEIADGESWETLVQSESGTGVYYERAEICVVVDGGATAVPAVTFVITQLFYLPKMLRLHVRPSQRYLDIIRDGAQKEQLSALVGQLETVKCARRPGTGTQVVGLVCGVWVLYASGNWLRFTVWPYTYVGARLFYMKEKLAEEGGGGVVGGVMYCVVSIAYLMLTMVYFVASVLRLPVDAEMRPKFFAMLKKMMKR